MVIGGKRLLSWSRISVASRLSFFSVLSNPALKAITVIVAPARRAPPTMIAGEVNSAPTSKRAPETASVTLVATDQSAFVLRLEKIFSAELAILSTGLI